MTKRTEIRDFLFWIFCITLHIVYLCWTFIPDSILHKYGITYYPSKHWAVVLPAFGIVLFNFLSNYFFLTSKMYTLGLESVNNLRDNHTIYTKKVSINENLMVDIPTAFVSKQLYG